MIVFKLGDKRFPMVVRRSNIFVNLSLILMVMLVGACAAQTPVPNQAVPTPIIVTLQPRTPEHSATPKPPTATATLTVTPTPPPTITASGPTIASNAVNVYAIATGAPLNIGPFHMVPTNTFVDNRGSGLILYYQTDDGAIYTVAVFLGLTLQDAVDRYLLEINSITDKQSASVGDEAVYAPTDIKHLFVIRFRNTVILINRPPANGTVPTTKITADQAKQLALLIYNAIPKT